jgi:hypothetical protein
MTREKLTSIIFLIVGAVILSCFVMVQNKTTLLLLITMIILGYAYLYLVVKYKSWFDKEI